MADSKITGLPPASSLIGSEVIELAQAGASVQTTLDNVAEYVNAGLMMRLASNYTLTSTTAQQKLFNVGSSGLGTFTVPSGIYLIKTMIYLSSMSATTGNGTFDIKGAGTATIGNSLRHSVGIDSTTPTTAATQTGAWSINTTSNNLGTNATGTAMAFEINGFMDITTGGTLIPSISLTTAAAAVVNAPSFCVIQRLADTGITYAGAVS